MRPLISYGRVSSAPVGSPGSLATRSRDGYGRRSKAGFSAWAKPVVDSVAGLGDVGWRSKALSMAFCGEWIHELPAYLTSHRL